MSFGSNHRGDSSNSSFKNSCGSIEADNNRIILNASEQKVRLKLVMVMVQNCSEIFRLKNEINSYRDIFKDI
jgi:hypothetical protein